ncbi:hypothetical protein [Phytohabitans houttuyneae]|uniref:Heparinase II N-terminal domain-containing protein n=1 Tax=Phytohabitans houttuyneae TaxID=1076126 RepID=A0A6V8KN38_9ACTN|nr:hypothetical protein [Phytohabitans houttuyneae]GFJ83978.1 hypothetical protein Phou_081580 [Phytohabitans houttuyneae]
MKLLKRRTSLALFGIGAALLVVAVVAANHTPDVAILSSGGKAGAPATGAPATGALLTCGDSDTELPSYPDRGITLPDVPLPERERHPRLDFTEADLPRIRERATGGAADPHRLYARNWQRILADVTSGDFDGDSADDAASRRAKANAFAYAVTGNPSYREQALSAMESAFRGFDSDDAYIAAQLTNYTQAYDYVAGDGAADELRPARAAIKRGAQWLADWINGEQPEGSNPRPHNHRSKAALALGLWSLVFAADPAARDWLALAVEQVNTVYRYMFTRDGVYLDGYAYYWTYQIFQVVPFLYAVRNIAGVDAFAPMRPVFEWMVRDSGPQGWLMNIEDSWVKTAWTAVVAGPYLSADTKLSRTAALGNVLQWRFFAQDWAATRYPESWTGASNQAYVWPDEIIHIDQDIAETAPDADGFDFYDRGGNTTVMRSDWRYGDRTTRWVMFYGAPQSNNHDHCDVMQVLLNAENTVLLNDSGYGPKRFSERSAWTPPDRHNVVTMDGAGVRDVFANPVNLNGAAADYSEKLAYYDQSVPGEPGTRSWRRGVLFAAHDYVVVADSLHSPQEQQWDSYLRARGTFERQGPLAVWTTPDNVFGDSAKLYAFTLPSGGAESTGSGWSNLFGAKKAAPDTEQTTFVHGRQRAAAAQFLSVAVPRPASAAAPVFTDQSGPGTLAASVAYDGHTDTVLKQLENTERTAGSLSTDGRLAWTRQAGPALTAWQLVDGTRLAHGGKSYVEASARLSLTADLAARLPVVDVAAGSTQEYTLRVAGTYATATFDGAGVVGRPTAS